MIFTYKKIENWKQQLQKNKSITQTNGEHNRTLLDMNFIKDYTSYGDYRYEGVNRAPGMWIAILYSKSIKSYYTDMIMDTENPVRSHTVAV